MPAFRDNDIDAEVLPKLTADDLIGLGVTSIGHRRKLLDAIATFGAEGPATTATGRPTMPRHRPVPSMLIIDQLGLRLSIHALASASVLNVCTVVVGQVPGTMISTTNVPSFSEITR